MNLIKLILGKSQYEQIPSEEYELEELEKTCIDYPEIEMNVLKQLDDNNKQEFPTLCLQNKMLCSYAENGQLEELKCIVNQGAHVQTNNNYALRYASLNGHLDVVRFLLEKGANKRERDNAALRYASEKGHLEIVKLLS